MSTDYFHTAVRPLSNMEVQVQPSGKYRGRCKYKTNNCPNERTYKLNGEAHTLCEKHRKLHNRNQRKSDRKRRAIRKTSFDSLDSVEQNSPISVSRFQPYPQYVTPMPLTVTTAPLPMCSRETGGNMVFSNVPEKWQWSKEEIIVLQDLLNGPSVNDEDINNDADDILLGAYDMFML